MKERIIINEPYIKKENEKTKLVAKIQLPSKDIEFFYEVDSKYEEYLTPERADAFLLMVLEYAMTKSLDIECKAPVTEQLYYQLTKYFIPILSMNRKLYNNIDIIANVADEIMPVELDGEFVNGTGISGGVDSFYAILSCLNKYTEKHKLTHLVFTNNGSLSPNFDYEESVNYFNLKCKEFKSLTEELNLEFLSVNTNMLELYSELKGMYAINAGAVKTISIIYSLKKFFHYYWFASSFDYSKFHFSEIGEGYYDLFTLNMLSISGLIFYSPGAEVPTRIEKTKYIANNKVVQKYLTICSNNNCGICNKCVRTLTALYLMDKLDDFSAVYNIEHYKKHMTMLLIKYFSIKKEFKMGYAQEILKEAKIVGGKKKRKILLCRYISILIKPLVYLKRKLKKLI